MAATKHPAISQEIADLRRRVDELSAEMAQLKRAVGTNGATKKRPWWELIAGQFDGDPLFAEIVKEGRAWRESQRPQKRGGRARS
jgi:hypothetical protein